MYWRKSLILLASSKNQLLSMMSVSEVVASKVNRSDNHLHSQEKKTKNPKGKHWKKKFERRNKLPSDRPSHFLAVQISNPAIKGGMKAVQDAMVAKIELLKNVVVSVNTAHITLGLLYLPDEAAIKEAADVLNNCKSIFEETLKGQLLDLKVSGIGHFGGSVVFASVQSDENEEKLKHIAGIIDKEFESLRSTSFFNYLPHITMMKLSKLRSPKLKKKIRRIDISLFKSYDKMYFGNQLCNSVQLLSMFKKKQDDGYYQCEWQLMLNTDFTESKKDLSSESIETYSDFLSSYILTSALCDVSHFSDSENDADCSKDSHK